jgi:hypothetical protein
VPAAATRADRAAIVTVMASVATAQPIAQASATKNKNDCDTGISDDGRRQRCHFAVGAFLERLTAIAVQKRLIQGSATRFVGRSAAVTRSQRMMTLARLMRSWNRPALRHRAHLFRAALLPFGRRSHPLGVPVVRAAGCGIFYQ